jgi:D-lyxose ketol-isomerase
MLNHLERQQVYQKTLDILKQTGLTLNPAEIEKMEIADFGLGEIEISGAQIITLVDTPQIAAKILVMLPEQTEPEHTHPAIGEYAGKEETIRCEWGELYLYSPGEPTPNPKGHPPAHRLETYTVWKENVLYPGDQITFPPNTPHWFQGGPQGAVIWSFSTKVVDKKDVFTDPEIVR